MFSCGLFYKIYEIVQCVYRPKWLKVKKLLNGWNNILCTIAKVIISDRGSAFTSAEFADFFSEYDIKHVKIATGSPQANR